MRLEPTFGGRTMAEWEEIRQERDRLLRQNKALIVLANKMISALAAYRGWYFYGDPATFKDATMAQRSLPETVISEIFRRAKR